MENILENEANNGVRWSWNILPATKLEASRMVMPVGCLYTPLKDIKDLPVLDYEPVVCGNCRSILNPFW
jgi:protein transport protein SEC23